MDSGKAWKDRVSNFWQAKDNYFWLTQNGIQWRNRRGGRVPPQRLLTGNFLLTYREKRGNEKSEKGWKLRRKGGKLEMQAGKRQKKRWGPFFFFFFFLLFTFENDENLFWVYQNGNFLPGKSISRREKNQEKWLCPLRKICLLRPWWHPPNCKSTTESNKVT